MPILDLGKLSNSFIVKTSVGTIVIWDDVDDIPDGWHICDGTEGTPDLQGNTQSLAYIQKISETPDDYVTEERLQEALKNVGDGGSNGTQFNIDHSLTLTPENVLGVTNPIQKVTESQFELMRPDEKKGFVIIDD